MEASAAPVFYTFHFSPPHPNNSAHPSANFSTLNSPSTRARPTAPIFPRSSTFPHNRSTAAGHCSHASGNNPAAPSPLPTNCPFTPTGDAITGSPAAMYCTILNPHFPAVHAFSGVGAIPTSPRNRAAASPSKFHRTKSSVSPSGTAGTTLHITVSRSPGTLFAASSSAGSASCRYFNVLADPIHTSPGVPVAACRFTGYRPGSTPDGITRHATPCC
jgi:hypothetical protein